MSYYKEQIEKLKFKDMKELEEQKKEAIKEKNTTVGFIIIVIAIVVLFITWSFVSFGQCNPDTTSPTFVPYPPLLIEVTELSDVEIPSINAVDECSDVAVSYTLTLAGGCNTEECYAIEWFAIDSSGNQSIAYTFIEVSDPLSIDENYINYKLNAYPNPSDGIFIIESDEPYKIYDMKGSEIRKEDVTPGMYFIRTATRSIKLIIND